MSLLSELAELKKEAEQARREADKAAGALEQLHQRLQDDFGCASVDEARKELVRLEKEEKALLRQYEKLRQEYTERWTTELEQ